MCAVIAVLLALSIVGSEPARGVVRDSQGQPIAGAAVALQCGGQIRETHTDGNGAFSFDFGGSAGCDLIVTSPGFQPVFLQVRTGIVEIELTPAGWDERVEVRANRLSPSQVATALPASPAAGAATLNIVGPDPARWLMLASRAAGDPLGTPTLVVNGLPASRLASTDAAAAITAAADPFGVESWGADRLHLQITLEPPRQWQFSGSPGLFTARRRDLLVDHASQWSQQRRAHAAGPLSRSGDWRMFASGTSTRMEGTPTYIERRDGMDRLAADVAGAADTDAWAGGLFTRQGAWTLNASIAATRMRATNAGVGGRFAANAAAAHASDAAAGQMTWRYQGRRAVTLLGMSLDREQRHIESTASGAAVLVADRLLEGAPDYTGIDSRSTRATVRLVTQSAGPGRHWLAGAEWMQDDRFEHRTPNSGGIALAAPDDPRPVAWLQREGEVIGTAATHNLAVFAQQVVVDHERVWVRTGVRAEHERGQGFSILPRASAGWRMGSFIAGANLGRFAETWSATEEIERAIRSTPATITTAGGDVLTLGLIGRGARRTDTVARASVVRTFTHVSLAIEETLTFAGHLSGVSRRRDGSALIDRLGDDRSLKRRQTHLRMDVAMKTWLATVHYQHAHSRDDAPGTFALPAWQHRLAAERGPTSGIPEHAITTLVTGRAPFGARVLFTARFQTGVPYSALTGLDPESLLTFSGRLHAIRNSSRLPRSGDAGIYLARRTPLVAGLVLDTGVRVENLLGSLIATDVERLTSSNLFQQPISAAGGRRVTAWASIALR